MENLHENKTFNNNFDSTVLISKLSYNTSIRS